MIKTRADVVCGLLPFLMACSVAKQDRQAEEGVEQIQQAGRGYQGRGYQGRGYQGTETGIATVEEVRVNGAAVSELRLEGTVLRGTAASGALAGADFIGATVKQRDESGALFDSTITQVMLDSQDSSGEILLYTLTAMNPQTGAVENVCAPDANGQRYATPVYGTWDASGNHVPSTTQFMFACTSGVVAKCVRWGYKPWKTHNGTPLQPYLQACTRMARADYCGDGVSHTEDGTLIDLYDGLGIQTKSPPSLLSPLLFDAAWTPQGAYCITKERWLRLLQLVTVPSSCKTKFADLFPLLETSPVDSSDLCGVKHSERSRSSVLMDNRSGLNISLF